MGRDVEKFTQRRAQALGWESIKSVIEELLKGISRSFKWLINDLTNHCRIKKIIDLKDHPIVQKVIFDRGSF